MAWENSQEQAKALRSSTYLGDPEEALGSWLQISLARAFAAAWGVDQWTEDLCLSCSLYIQLSNKNKIFFLRKAFPQEVLSKISAYISVFKILSHGYGERG